MCDTDLRQRPSLGYFRSLPDWRDPAPALVGRIVTRALVDFERRQAANQIAALHGDTLSHVSGEQIARRLREVAEELEHASLRRSEP